MKFLIEIEVTRIGAPNRSREAVWEALEMELPSGGMVIDVDDVEYEIVDLQEVEPVKTKR